MKKILLSLTAIILFPVLIFFSLITFTNFEKVYQEFAKTTRLDVSNVKEDNIKLVKFPTPHLFIDEIKQSEKLELKNIDIKFSILSLLIFNPKITEITVGEAVLHLQHDDVNFLNHDEFISELISKDFLSMNAKINNLKFVEIDGDIPISIDDFYLNKEKDKISFKGKLSDFGEIKGEFITTSDSVVLFKLDAIDENYNFHIEENYNQGKFEAGIAILKASNLLNKIIPLIPDFTNLSNYLNSSEEVTIGCNLLPSDNSIILEKLAVNSDSISGNGKIKLGKTKNDLTEIDFEFSKIDFANLSKSSVNNYNSSSTEYFGNSRFDFSKNNLISNIVIKEIKLSETNSLTDIKFSTKIDNAQLYLEDLYGKIGKSGQFRINGVATQNSFRNIFNGSIALTHSDLNDIAEFIGGSELKTEQPIAFLLSSDIKFTSVDFSLQNLLLKTDNTQVSGNISTKFIGGLPRTNANVKFTSINVDQKNFPAISHTFSYLSSLLEGMKEEKYLNKFIPIRKITSMNNYDITFDRLVLNGKSYENVNFNLDFSPGKVSVERLYIKDGKDWVDTSFLLEAQGVKPNLLVVIHNGSLYGDFLSAQGMASLSQKILDNFDLSKVDIVLEGSLRNLYKNNFELNNVVFSVKNDKNLLNFTKFNALLFGGKFESSGSILLNPYTLNFVYALNSAKVEEVSSLLPKGILDSSGVFSASGMLSTNGEKLNEQLYNLYTKSDIVTKDIKINNFSLDNFIQELSTTNYNIASFEDDLNKMLLTGQTQIDDMKAEIELSKGVTSIQSVVFKTQYSSGSASASFNIYDFNIDLLSNISFYLSKPRYGRSSIDYAPVKMSITAKGNFLNPKKEAQTQELKESLINRVKK